MQVSSIINHESSQILTTCLRGFSFSQQFVVLLFHPFGDFALLQEIYDVSQLAVYLLPGQ